MDPSKVHPLYKIVAVLCVGSVAKALFAEPRPINNTVYNAGRAVADAAADKVIDSTTKGA